MKTLFIVLTLLISSQNARAEYEMSLFERVNAKYMQIENDAIVVMPAAPKTSK